MKRATVSHWRRWLCVLLLLAAGASQSQQAPSLLALQDAGRLQLNSWIEPQRGIVVKQQVVLQIEVSSDTWFTAGTRIGRLELDDVVVLKRENFAVNSTRRSGGKTFTVQLWSITLYPQRAGRIDIPPIALELSIAGDDQQSITGTLMTSPLSFEVELPAGLQAAESWITASNFRIEENYNRDLDALEPGDAVQRQVTISGENIAAMMLPELLAQAQPGLAVYQKPSRLSDDNNRGAFQARRTESITYLVEKPGSYRLPAQTFYWWDLDSDSLRKLTLPERVLNATGGAATVAADAIAAPRNTWKPVVMAGLLVALVAVIWRVWRRRRQQRTPTAAPHKSTEKQLQRQLYGALRERDWQRLVQLLYLWLDNYGGESYDGSIRETLRRLQQPQWQRSLDQLMLAAFYSRDCEQADIAALLQLLLVELQRHDERHWWRATPIELELN